MFKRYLQLHSYIAENKDREARKEAMQKRAAYLSELQIPGIVKLAFDTRRVDQENEYNPRRNLQNYHRSEPFVSLGMETKILNFNKLRKILEELKDQYGKLPEWQDSYCRVLLNAITRALRINEKDGDFSENQPSLGSLDYIEELLHVRYRLSLSDLNEFSSEELKEKILSKDELTLKNKINDIYVPTKTEIVNRSYDELLNKILEQKNSNDSLIEKLFGGLKADKNNKSIKRSVTITIQDDYLGDEAPANIEIKEKKAE